LLNLGLFSFFPVIGMLPRYWSKCHLLQNESTLDSYGMALHCLRTSRHSAKWFTTNYKLIMPVRRMGSRVKIRKMIHSIHKSAKNVRKIGSFTEKLGE